MQFLTALLIGTLFSTVGIAAAQTTGTADTQSPHPATVPAMKTARQERFLQLHKSFIERGKKGAMGVLFLGDSITERWSSHPLTWEKHFGKYNPANFGIGGDRTQHILWRIDHGELDNISPQVLVLMIGTNNANDDPPEAIVQGIKNIVDRIRSKLPQTKILLLGIFPRDPRKGEEDNKPMERIREVNPELLKLDDGKSVRYLDISRHFLQGDSIPDDIMPDQVHLSEKGYEIWGKALEPVLEEMMTTQPLTNEEKLQKIGGGRKLDDRF